MASFSGGDYRCSFQKRVSLPDKEFSSPGGNDFMLDVSDGSDDSSEWYENSEESDASDDEVFVSARLWTKVNGTSPPTALPCFSFIVTPGVNIDLNDDDPLDSLGAGKFF